MVKSSRKRLCFAGIILTLLIGGVFVWWSLINRPYQVAIPPPPPVPSPNAYDCYIQALKQLRYACLPDYGNPKALGLDWDDGLAAKYTLAQRDQLLAATRTGLGKLREGFAYPFQAPFAPPESSVIYGALYQTKRGYRDEFLLARYLKFAADTSIMHGDWDGAMTCDLDALRLGSDIPQHDGMFGMSSATSCQRIGRVNIWKVIDHLNATQARAATQRLQEIIHRQVSQADMWQQTTWGRQAWLLQLFRQTNWRQQLQDHYGTNWQEVWEHIKYRYGPLDYLSFRMVSKRKLLTDYSDYMNRIIAESRKPYAVRASIPDPVGPQVILDPRYNQVTGLVSFNDTQNTLLLTALALQAYKAEHGDYPPALTNLLPSYLAKLPDDPFARAGCLRYAVRGEKYLLYSIGPDGVDDGGRPVDEKWAFEGSKYFPLCADTPRGDIVAGINIR